MNRKGLREAIADVATIAIAVVAVVMAGSVAWDRFRGAEQVPSAGNREVANWDELVEGGHRLGPESAEVVIVEFGDYECPFCNAAEPVLRVLRESNPERLTLVYRHYPLSYHRHAYRAARLAECAAEQDRFEFAHAFLYDVDDLAEIDSADLLAPAAIPDSARFLTCASQDGDVSRIESDLAAGENAGITGTPAFVVNGWLISPTPDSARLHGMIESALENAQLRRDDRQ